MSTPDPAQNLANLFQAAADIVTGQRPPEGSALALLHQLGYRDTDPADAGNRAALLRAAAGFRRVFTLANDQAPGLVAFGAEASAEALGQPDAPVGGVSGTGLTAREAFESCVGEGVEFISQFVTPDDPIMRLTEAEALARTTPAMSALWQRLRPYRQVQHHRTDWIAAADLSSGQPILAPADLCFRRPRSAREIETPWALSIGCGAGPGPLQAALHGVLELIERDAVCLWWRGGVRARVLPPNPGSAALAQLRGAAAARHTWLLDITSDIGVPVVAAASCDDDGFGLCVGHAARPSVAEAADAALMEMAQMELAYQLAERKRAERGESGLNALDRGHISRFTSVSVADMPALHPMAPPNKPVALPTDDRVQTMQAIGERLERQGLSACVLNLTRPGLGIAVTRALCPGLELGLTAPPGPRLLAVTGGVAPPECVPL